MQKMPAMNKKPVKSKPITYSAKWIKNAARSIGITTTEVLSSLAPNITDVATSATSVTTDIVSSLRKGKNGNRRISDLLNSNRYVQALNTTFKNVKSDLKTGNLYNNERDSSGSASKEFDDFKDSVENSFTFDDSASDDKDINVNYINKGGSDASLNNLSDQISKAATANVKMQKASMDAYVAVSAANMQQSGKIGSDILTQLGNINNHLAALNQFNNENMSKFITASLGYFEKAGNNMDLTSGNSNNSNTNAVDNDNTTLPVDLLNHNNGGINLANYKKFIKQNINKTIEQSDAGMLKAVLDGPLLDEFVANPIGSLGKVVVQSMMPKMVTESIKGVEDAFSNMAPMLLKEIGDLSKRSGNNLGDIILRNVGKIFGVTDDPTESRTNIGRAKLNRGAIPFDGETKYALTNIIPNELKLQTAYLKNIALGKTGSHSGKVDTDKLTLYSFRNNKEMTRNDINLDIANTIIDSIQRSMSETKFGESLQQLVTDQFSHYDDTEEGQKKAEAASKEVQESINELYFNIEKHTGKLDLASLIQLVKDGAGTPSVQEAIIDKLTKMEKYDSNSFDSLTGARFKLKADLEAAKQNVLNNAADFNVMNSDFFGENVDTDKKIREILKYGKENGSHKTDTHLVNKISAANGDVTGKLSDASLRESMANRLFGVNRKENSIADIMHSMMQGKGGEAFSKAMIKISGKVDKFGDKLNTVNPKTIFSDITTPIKDGFMERMFGRKRDENGKYVETKDHKGGVVGELLTGLRSAGQNLTSTFKTFFIGNDKTGQQGIFKSISDGWNKGIRKSGVSSADLDSGKTNTIGMAGGALTAAMIGKMGLFGASLGPTGIIGGALAGLALSIKSQGTSFKEVLFGKEDGITLSDGKKIKKQGVIGKFLNGIEVNLYNPIKTAVSYVYKDFLNELSYNVLSPIKLLSNKLSTGVAKTFGKFGKFIMNKADGIAANIGEKIGITLDKTEGLVGQLISKGLTKFVWSPIKTVMRVPGNLIRATVSALDLKEKFKNFKPVAWLRAAGNTLLRVATNSIRTLFKGAFRLITSPLRLAFKGGKKLAQFVGKKTAPLRSKIKSSKFGKALDRIKEAQRTGNMTDAEKAVYEANKINIKEQYAANKRHDKNAKLIAKYSHKQFNEDSDEARQWLRENKPELYAKFISEAGDSITQERLKANKKDLERLNGMSSFGLSEEKLLGANFSSLTPEAQNAKILLRIEQLLHGITDEDDEETTDENGNPVSTSQSSDATMEGTTTENSDNNSSNTDNNAHNGNHSSNASINDEESGSNEEGISNNTTNNNSSNTSQSSQTQSGGRFSRAIKKVGNYFKTQYGSIWNNTIKNSWSKTLEDRDNDVEADYQDALTKLYRGYNVEEYANSVDNRDLDEVRKKLQREGLFIEFAEKVNKLCRKYGKPEIFHNISADTAEGGGNGLGVTKCSKAIFVTGGKGPDDESEKEDKSSKKKNSFTSIIRKNASDKLAKARDAATTAKENMDRVLQEKKDKEESKYKKTMLSGIKNIGKNVASHAKGFFSIFGKKGLITVAILGGIAFLKSKFPKLFDTLGEIGTALVSTAANIAKFAGGFVGQTVSSLVESYSQGNRANGNTMDEQLSENIEDIKNGTYGINENGDATIHNSYLTNFALGQGKNILKGAVGGLLSGTGKRAAKRAAKAASKEAYEATIKTAGKKAAKAASNKAYKNVMKNAAGATLKDVSAKGIKRFLPGAGIAKAETAVGYAGGKIAKKIGELVKKAFDALKKLFSKKAKGTVSDAAEKAGAEAIDKVADDTVKALAKNSDSALSKLMGKITAVTGGKAGLAAATGGIIEGVSIGLSALDGLTGAAKLFQVDKNDVDAYMRLIATVFGAVDGSTYGSIIMLVLDFLGSLGGNDIMHNLAVAIYNCMPGADAEGLQVKMQGFNESYLKDRDEELKKQFETQQKIGIINSDVSFDEFKSEVTDQTKSEDKKKYHANYTSKSDYNAKQNKSMFDHVGSFFGKVGKSIGKGIKSASHAIFGYTEKTYTDENGNIYRKNSDGSYQVTNASGEDLGSISKSALPENLTENKTKHSGVIGKAANIVGKTIKTSIDVAGSAFKGASKFVGKAFGKVKGLFSKANVAISTARENNDCWLDTEDNCYYRYNSDDNCYHKYNINGDDLGNKYYKSDSEIEDLKRVGILVQFQAPKYTKANKDSTLANISNIKEKLNDTFKVANNKVSAIIDKFASKFTKKDKKSSEQDENKNAKKNSVLEYQEVWYDANSCYYEANSDGSYNKYNVNGDLLVKDIDKEDVEDMMEKGLLTKSKKLDIGSTAKKHLANLQETIGSVFKKIFKNSEDGWNKVGNSTGGSGDGVDAYNMATGKLKNDAKSTKVKSFSESLSDTNKKTSTTVTGGSGDGTYYSQSDPEWANNSYGSDATMETTGCGPTAMAMVASDVTGKKIKPTEMANFAEASGNRDNTGTNWNFVNQASSAYGMSSSQNLNPTAQDISNELQSGNPVLLSGQSSSGNDPYTKAGHYVVATGEDENGNVSIKDPRGASYSKSYNINDLAESTGSSWSFGGGFGRPGTKKTSTGDDNSNTTKSRPMNGSIRHGGVTRVPSTDISTNKVGGLIALNNNLGDINDETIINNAPSQTPWFLIVQNVFSQLQSQCTSVSLSAKAVPVTIGEKTISVKPTSDDFLNACLKFYGVLDEDKHTRSYDLDKYTNFTKYTFSSWDDVRSGDVLALKGNYTTVYIFSSNNPVNKKHLGYYVTNDTLKNGCPAEISNKKIAYIFRPSEVSSKSTITDSGFINTVETATEAAQYATNMTSKNTTTNTNPLSALASLFSSVGKTFMQGTLSGTSNVDWSSALSEFGDTTGIKVGNYVSNTGYGSNYGDPYYNGTGYTTTAKFTDSNKNRDALWTWGKKQNFTDAGLAGLIGNIRAESAYLPNNLQDTYNTSLGMSDEEYTQAVNDGTYKNFVNDSAGYGLAQWTSAGRKQGLLDYAVSKKKDISDLNMQLEWLLHELQSNSYKQVYDVLKSTNDVNEASNMVISKFEQPNDPDGSKAAQRREYSWRVYNTYAGKDLADITESEKINQTSSNKSSSKSSTSTNKKYDTDRNSQFTKTAVAYDGARSNRMLSGGFGTGNKSAKRLNKNINYANKSFNRSHGGRGGFGDSAMKATVNAGTMSNSSSAESIVRTLKATSPVNDILLGMAQMISMIVNNTADANTKLQALDQLKNLAKTSNFTNNSINVNNNSSNNSQSSQIKTKGEMKNDRTARAIARGGY